MGPERLSGHVQLNHGDPVSLSCRLYLVYKKNGIRRLTRSMSERLVHDPVNYPMLELAGKRMRVAEIAVELRECVPIRVVRRVYFVLAFDDHGRCDVDRLRKQQWAHVASVLDPVIAPPRDADDIRDATERFIAQSGRWRPAADLARLIDCAALGITA